MTNKVTILAALILFVGLLMMSSACSSFAGKPSRTNPEETSMYPNKTESDIRRVELIIPGSQGYLRIVVASDGLVITEVQRVSSKLSERVISHQELDAIFELVLEVSTNVSSGEYSVDSETHEPCLLILHSNLSSKEFELATGNDNVPPAPPKLVRLVKLISGLTKW